MRRFNAFSLAAGSLFLFVTVMSGGVAGASPLVSSGLVAEWNFEGDGADSAGGEFDATEFGGIAPSNYSDGVLGDAVYLNTGQYFETASTAAAWANWTFAVPSAHFCLRISRVRRMDSLLPAISPPRRGDGGQNCPASLRSSAHPPCSCEPLGMAECSRSPK